MSSEEKFNAIPVSMDELHLAVNEVHKMPEENCDWEGRTTTLAGLFAGEPEKGLAIDCRLTALSKIITTSTLPKEAVIFHGEAAELADCVWEAAAITPFKLNGTTSEAEFDQQVFLQAVIAFNKAARH